MCAQKAIKHLVTYMETYFKCVPTPVLENESWRMSYWDRTIIIVKLVASNRKDHLPQY